MSLQESLRLEIIATAQRMNALGINVNKSGNVSARIHEQGCDGFLITPSGIPYEDLLPEDIVFITLSEQSSSVIENRRLPSSEWQMHERIYRLRKDLSAIVHTHSPCATALACQDMDIPAFHYMVAAAGGDRIECAPYAPFGSKALANIAGEALSLKNACLLSHHGVLAAGKNLKGALRLAHEVENLAYMYILTRQLGEPKLLSAEQMKDVLKQFETYGQQR